MTAFYQWDGEDLLVHLHVQPRASRDEFAGIHDGALKVRITAPPVDGKANEHLRRLLAGEFGVPLRAVTLLSGDTGRRKKFRIRTPARFPHGVQQR